MSKSGKPSYPWLGVDRFIGDLVSAAALSSAFELKLIDALESTVDAALVDLAQVLNLEPPALGLLCDLLRASGVIERAGDQVHLSGPFRAVLDYRDLLLVKLEFARLVLPDVHDHLTELIADLPGFMEHSAVFDLFRYDRCFESTPENLAATRRWMRFTTVLTKYESEAFLDVFDISHHRRMLDIGGNSGEFALRLCRRYPALQATVYDLPVVCEVGETYLAPRPEAERIRFLRGDARRGPLPPSHDLITFKSILHDWPEEEAGAMLSRAATVLDPGGDLAVFERGPIEFDDDPIPFSRLPDLLFNRFYRPPRFYSALLDGLGFESVSIQRLVLNMPFFIVSARKPA